jgi:hypothetical protein
MAAERMQLVGGRVQTDASIRTFPSLQLKKREEFPGAKICPMCIWGHPCPKFCTNSPPGIGLLGWWGGYQRNSITPWNCWNLGNWTLEPGRSVNWLGATC